MFCTASLFSGRQEVNLDLFATNKYTDIMHKIKRGADPNSVDQFGNTVLVKIISNYYEYGGVVAAQERHGPQLVDTVRFLLNYRYHRNGVVTSHTTNSRNSYRSRNRTNSDGDCVVDCVADTIGIDIDKKNNDGVTALFVAVQKKLKDITKLLLAAGASIHVCKPSGMNIVMAAASSGYHELLYELLDTNSNTITNNRTKRWIDNSTTNSTINSTTNTVTNTVTNSTSNGRSKRTTKSLIDVNAQDKSGNTAINYALQNEDRSTASVLIQLGADITIRNKNGVSVLMQSVMLYSCIPAQDIVVYVNNIKDEFVQEEFDSSSNTCNADCSAVDCDNKTIDFASQVVTKHDNQCSPVARRTTTVKKLDLVDNEGNTALHFSILHVHILHTKLLIEAGASINIMNKDGETPLAVAVSKGCIPTVKLLLNSNANINTICMNERTPLAVAISSSIDLIIYYNDTNRNYLDITKLLLEQSTIVVDHDLDLMSQLLGYIINLEDLFELKKLLRWHLRKQFLFFLFGTNYQIHCENSPEVAFENNECKRNEETHNCLAKLLNNMDLIRIIAEYTL